MEATKLGFALRGVTCILMELSYLLYISRFLQLPDWWAPVIRGGTAGKCSSSEEVAFILCLSIETLSKLEKMLLKDF